MESSSRDRKLSQEVAAIKESLMKLINHKAIEEFALIWDHIGVEDRIKNERREKMLQYHTDLMMEMLEEEKALKKRMEDSIESCSIEMKQLETQLQLSSSLESYLLKTMLEKERLIRERVDALNKIKHERMKRLKRLMEMESALAHSMGDKPLLSIKWQEDTSSIPSETDLQNYRKTVEQLESTKDQRQVEFRNIRDKSLFVWEELETKPTDEFGLKLYNGNVSQLVLSEVNMKKLEEYYQELEASAKLQECEAESLRKSIISLWDRLDIPVEFREDFLSQHQGYKTFIIEELRSEVERLNILKQCHLEQFIEATRIELHKVWDQCFYGDNQRKEFTPAYSDEYDDDCLSAHESELDKMRGFFADNNEIFKLIEKRESLWQQKIEMDIRASDPGRLNNRGGKLLQEQRLHQKVNKELPKVEKKLENILNQWEDDHCRHFVIKDQRYLDNLESRWNDYHQSKEQEKIKRQQQRTETTMMEMKFGTKTPTPKRKAPGPASNDRVAKVQKIGVSPLVKSAKLTPARRVAKRKILKERNKTNPSTPEKGFDFSLSSAGSYTEFQRGFNNALENNSAFRSSIITRGTTNSTTSTKHHHNK